jgi:hypothetical protein
MARFVVGNDRRRRSIAADALDAVALDEDVTRKRFGAQAIDDPDIGEERACHSASLGISQKARRRIAQSDCPPRGTENSSCPV